MGGSALALDPRSTGRDEDGLDVQVESVGGGGGRSVPVAGQAEREIPSGRLQLSLRDSQLVEAPAPREDRGGDLHQVQMGR